MGENTKYKKLSKTESSTTIFLVVIWALLISFAIVAAQNPPWLAKLAKFGQIDESTSLKEYGDNFMRQRDYAKAISHYRKALDIKPDNYVIMTSMAIAYHKAGNSDEGLKLLNKALNFASATKGPIYFNMGEILFDRGQKSEAIEYYLKAVDSEINQEVLSYKIGRTYKEIGRLDKAREAFEKTVEIQLEPRTPYLSMIRASLAMYESDPQIFSALNAMLTRGISEKELDAYDVDYIRQINSANKNLIGTYRELVKICDSQGDSLGAAKYAELAQNAEKAYSSAARARMSMSGE